MSPGRISAIAVSLLLYCTLPFSVSGQVVKNYLAIQNPDDLEVDNKGNLWVNYKDTVRNLHCLAMIDGKGKLKNIIEQNNELGQFGITDTHIWASSWSASRAWKFDRGGKVLDSVSIAAPTEIIAEPEGNWYVYSSARQGMVTKFKPDNSSATIASGSGLGFGAGMARDAYGNFYTTGLFNGQLFKITADGKVRTIAHLPFTGGYSLGFCNYKDGYIYIPSIYEQCIYKIDTGGRSVELVAGKPGQRGSTNGNVSEALMDSPLSAEPSFTGDTLFFTQSGNLIRMVTGLKKAPVSTDSRNYFLKLTPDGGKLLIDINLTGRQAIQQVLVMDAANKPVGQVAGYDPQKPVQQLQYDMQALAAGNYNLLLAGPNGFHVLAAFTK